jgi:glycerol kinase
VVVVPAFTGIGAPYWDMYARGGIFGVTRGTKREHIIRAAQEAIAYQSADLVVAMEKDTGVKLRRLNVDGGASRDGFLMQFQADILDAEVVKPTTHETTALGVALLAGLTVGVWKDKAEICRQKAVEKTYRSQMDDTMRQKKLRRWHKAVDRCLGWELE